MAWLVFFLNQLCDEDFSSGLFFSLRLVYTTAIIALSQCLLKHRKIFCTFKKAHSVNTTLIMLTMRYQRPVCHLENCYIPWFVFTKVFINILTLIIIQVREISKHEVFLYLKQLFRTIVVSFWRQVLRTKFRDLKGYLLYLK